MRAEAHKRPGRSRPRARRGYAGQRCRGQARPSRCAEAPARLLLADDHTLVRQALARIFADTAEARVVAEVASGGDVVEALRSSGADVVLLDLSLPEGGFPLIATIRRVLPHVRIVVLTMHDHERHAMESLAAGAGAFVAKGADFSELVAAIRAVRSGRAFVSAAVAARLFGSRHGMRRTDAVGMLSRREFETLLRLTRGQSLKQAAAELGISEKTVTTYRGRLMSKLNLATRVDMTRFAAENGLLAWPAPCRWKPTRRPVSRPMDGLPASCYK